VSIAEVAVHGGRGRLRPSRWRTTATGAAERPLLRLITFTALAFYGVLRWATLESPAPGGRLLGLLAVAVVVAGAGPWLDRRSRPLLVAALLVAFAATLAICGIPVSWLVHARVAVTAQAIGQGLSDLPGALVPYLGVDPWLRLVILLGAGALLLDAAIMIAFAPRKLGDLRRAGAALPLIALAVVPATLVRPQLPYLQGMILFALVAAFMWGERVAPRRGLGAVGVVGMAGVAGMIVGPLIEQHHAWVNPRGLAGAYTAVRVDTFDWTQSYGPFSWPRDSRHVLEVRAARPDYWKAENLDVFTGVGWAQAPGVTGSKVPALSPAIVRRYTQTLTVTVGAMDTLQVIGAGYSYRPAHLQETLEQGGSPGTWTVLTPLHPGDSYTVRSYSPDPTPAQLQADDTSYPANGLQDELTLGLPIDRAQTDNADTVQFPPFHSGGTVNNVVGPSGVSGLALIQSSPYARAYALATRLADAAANPYSFATAIERYLSPSNGFVYDEHPPPSSLPLESFLFSSKHGYCQQFAGAMALLLRMGGVPARVATGFTSGDYNAAAQQYVVSDLDAHAWVEAWFPRYGWVRFDPTPGSAPARSRSTALLPALSGAGSGHVAHHSPRQTVGDTAGGSQPNRRHGSGSALSLALVLAGLVVVLGAAVLLAARRTRRLTSAQQLVAELERALARSGRPLQPGTTLYALEQRFGSSPEAAGYVRALRLARFADQARLPLPGQRRALRSQLAAGLGPTGRVRAWWALPPRVLH
jgi:transglutaminase-like putative cysteine protease